MALSGCKEDRAEALLTSLQADNSSQVAALSRFGGLRPPEGVQCMLALSTGDATDPIADDWSADVDVGFTQIRHGMQLWDLASLNLSLSKLPLGSTGEFVFDLQLITSDWYSALCDGPSTAVLVVSSGVGVPQLNRTLDQDGVLDSSSELLIGTDDLIGTPYHASLLEQCGQAVCEAQIRACNGIARVGRATGWQEVRVPIDNDTAAIDIIVGERRDNRLTSRDAVLLLANARLQIVAE